MRVCEVFVVESEHSTPLTADTMLHLTTPGQYIAESFQDPSHQPR